MWYLWFGKKILPLVKYGGVVLLGLVVVLSFAQNLPIPGNFQSLVVMSGSMEPKIHTGSVAIVKPSEEVKVDDIITFKDPREPKNLITHRISEISENEIIKTKGDANNTPDNWEVTKDNIVGKFLFSVPLLGYAVNFAKQPPGFLLLILFPALLIIINEIGSIKRETLKTLNAKDTDAKNAKRERREKGTRAAVAASAVLLTFAFSSGATSALFSDTVTSTGNTITAGVWDTVNPGDVVINEVEYDSAQSGTDSDYEWFELYNNKSSPITLSGWTVTDNTNTDIIPDLTLPAGGFAVVAAKQSGFEANYSGFSGLIVYLSDGKIGNGLANGGDRLVLKDDGGTEIDAVSWGSDTYAFGIGNGIKPLTDDGKSIARKPKGFDTNSSSDWEILSSPNPGTNPHPSAPTSPEEPASEPEKDAVPEPEAEPEVEPEPEPESVAVSATPEDPPESSASAQPALESVVPESTESAQPKDSDE